MSVSPKHYKIDVDALQYYFDGVEHDYLAKGSLNLRTSQWLRIRDRLLHLPPQVYDATIKIIEGLVEQQLHEAGIGEGAPSKAAQAKTKVVGGQRLFENLEGDRKGSATKANVSAVSRVE